MKTKDWANFVDSRHNDAYMTLSDWEKFKADGIAKSANETAEKDTTDDPVNHPSHYCVGGFECKDVMIALFGVEDYKTFCKLNAFKYLFRTDNKNGEQDLAKAKWYLTEYFEL